MKRSPSTEELSKLLLTLYAAPTNPELWPRFLSELTAILGLGGAALLFQDLSQPFVNVQALVGIDPVANPPYEDYYSRMDEWRPLTLSMPEGKIALAEELCPPQRLKKTEFYNDFLRRYQVNLFCAIPTVNRPPALEIVTFYHHGWQGKPCDPAVLDTIQILLPHIRSALRTRRHLCTVEANKQEFSCALDLVDFGVVFIGQDGACLYVNRVARDIFDRRDGLYFRNGRIWAGIPSESAQLRRVIDQAIGITTVKNQFSGGALCVSRLNRPPLQVLVSPFVAERSTLSLPDASRAVAIAFLFDPMRSRVGTERAMQMLYGLTEAETKLLKLLISGRSLYEAAELNGIARETARTQMKSVLSKTGTRSQSDLMRVAAITPPHRTSTDSRNQTISS